MTSYERWQLEKFGNLIPEYPNREDDVQQDFDKPLPKEEFYIYTMEEKLND